MRGCLNDACTLVIRQHGNLRGLDCHQLDLATQLRLQPRHPLRHRQCHCQPLLRCFVERTPPMPKGQPGPCSRSLHVRDGYALPSLNWWAMLINERCGRWIRLQQTHRHREHKQHREVPTIDPGHVLCLCYWHARLRRICCVLQMSQRAGSS